MNFQQANARAAEIKQQNPKLIVGAAMIDGEFVIITGKNRRRLNTYARGGKVAYEFVGNKLMSFSLSVF